MSQTAIPAHVPPELVRDFDLYDFPGAKEDVYEAWRAIRRDSPPVFYTPSYGGYWVLTRADDLDVAWADAETFSSHNAVGIPIGSDELPPMIPIGADAPLHTDLRRPLNIAVSPRQVATLAPQVRALAQDLIRALKPRGECEFVKDFSLKLPMEIFLKLVDLPSEDREYLISLAQVITKTSDLAKRTEANRKLNAYLEDVIEARRVRPGEDLLSKVVHLNVLGRSLSHREALGYATQLLTGGLDTVGATMSMMALHLARHPEHRRAIAGDPSLIPDAVEEFVRRYSLPTIGRRVTRDVVIGGVQMKAGDMVMLNTISHALDDSRWSDPAEVKLDRQPTGHRGFGLGPHRCPGANLARSELRIFLEEWLKEIPDFSLKPGFKPAYLIGAVVGLESLPLVWPTH